MLPQLRLLAKRSFRIEVAQLSLGGADCQKTSVALASRDEADALTVDGLKNRTPGEITRPPAPPITMLTWWRRGSVKVQNRSNPRREVACSQHCIGGVRGDEEFAPQLAQVFDFLVHLLSTMCSLVMSVCVEEKSCGVAKCDQSATKASERKKGAWA